MDVMAVPQMRLLSKSYWNITYFIPLDEGISTGPDLPVWFTISIDIVGALVWFYELFDHIICKIVFIKSGSRK